MENCKKTLLRERVKQKSIPHTYYTTQYLVSKFCLLVPEQIQCHHILWDPIAICSHSKSERRMDKYFKTLYISEYLLLRFSCKMTGCDKD